ncbi:MAG: flippase [Prevotellaceae bacterium]|nr:flippase [Candidatus Colivivens equi]
MDIIKGLFRRLNASKEGKTVVANFGYLSLIQIAGYAFPLITMPYLARVIGTEGFGRIAFANAVLVWLQTIADWGFTFTATRDVAQHRDDKEKVSEIFSNVFWARCLLSLIAGVFLLIAIAFVPVFRENAFILLISYLLIPGHIMFPDWFFQAIEKMKYTTILGLVFRLFFTIMVFVVIKEQGDYYWQPLLTTIGYIICGIITLYLILGKWGYKLYSPQIKPIVQSIQSSADVFLNNLMPNLYNSFSVLLLGFWGGAYANGIYDGGNKFSTLVHQLQLVMSRAFYPFLSRRADKHHMFEVINNSAALLMAFALFIFAPILVHVMLGPEFEESITVLRILSVSIFFLGLSNTYGTNYLIIYHHERDLRNMTLIASFIGMAVAVPLVMNFTYIGAALTIVISRGLLGTLSYMKAKQYIKQNSIR